MKKVLALLGSLLLWGGMALAQSQEESLGEVARKLRANKPRGRLTKVYTNDDLARLGRGVISVVGQAGAVTSTATPSGGETSAAGAPAGATAAAGETAATPTEEKGEQYWKAKFAEVRSKIALAEKELDLLQREWQLQRTQFSQDPNEAMRQQYLGQQAGGKLNELQRKIQEKQAELNRYKQDLSKLEDDLRREGGNPGWARP